MEPCHATNLWIQDENKQNIALQQLAPSVGKNMLGVYMAPDRNNTDMAPDRNNADHVNKKWVDNMKDCLANPEEVCTALHRTIPFTIGYSLPTVTLTQKECQHIMAPINKVGLSRASILSTTKIIA